MGGTVFCARLSAVGNGSFGAAKLHLVKQSMGRCADKKKIRARHSIELSMYSALRECKMLPECMSEFLNSSSQCEVAMVPIRWVSCFWVPSIEFTSRMLNVCGMRCYCAQAPSC